MPEPSAADAAYVADWRNWYPAAFQIRNLEGQLERFRPSPAQVDLFETVQKLQDPRNPQQVRLMYLKARRVRMSTAVAALISRIVFFVPGQTAIVVAHNLEAAGDIFRYYRTFHSEYDEEAGRMKILRVERESAGDSPYMELEGGGWVRVHSATSANVPRGMSVRFLHMSETAFWPAPEKLLAGLLQGVPNDPHTMVFDESTANGRGTPHYLAWQRRSTGREGAWRTRFFGWWQNPINRMTLWPGEQAELERTLGLYPHEREHKEQFRLDWEQVKWRRHTLQTLCGGSPAIFAQEYPAHPEEAFLSSGRSRFSSAVLARQPIEHERAVQGELVMAREGLRESPRFEPRMNGALWLREYPVRGRHYVIGVDVASGRDAGGASAEGDPDYSVFQVLDVQTGMQVARYRARETPWDAAAALFALAVWYNGAFLVIENNGDGRAVIRELLLKEYPHAQLYIQGRQPHDMRPATLDEIGWTTTAQSKPVLISTLDGALHAGTVYVQDPVTSGELSSFVMKGNGKQEASDNCHDDTVIALALAVVGATRMKERAAFEDVKRAQAENRKREVEWALNRQRAADLRKQEVRRW